RVTEEPIGTVDREWERDLNPALSYIYDHPLRFGCPHQQTEHNMQLDTPIPPNQLEEFNSRFSHIEKQDPLKFAFLREFFEYTIQPVPTIPLEPFKLEKQYDASRILWAMMLARIANIPFLRALTSWGVSEWIRSMLHTSYRRLGILIPDPEELKKGHKPHRVEGALTIAPTPGAYFNMSVLDFESLYPSVIDQYNLSYETMDCGHTDCQSNQVPDEPHYVCTHRRGIFSALIGAIKDLRIHWFKPLSRQPDLPPKEQEQAKTISDLLKLLLVSSGGVTIRIHGLACPPLAESMMAYGRWALRTSWDYAVEHGMRPIYGDTDSLFLDQPAPQQIDWLIKKVKDQLKLQLAVDVVYPLCVFSSAKKAYFGILPDGTPDAKGITLGKSSSPPIFHRIFIATVKPLAGVDSPEKLDAAQSELIRILQEQLASLRQGHFTVADMEYRVKVWKDIEKKGKDAMLPQPYQALKQLQDKGVIVKRREEVGFVKVKPFRYGSRMFTVKPTSLAKQREIDIPDYIRKLGMAFEQVLVPLDIEFPSKQSKALDAFLSDDAHEPFSTGTESLESRPQSTTKEKQKRLVEYSEDS
ncbi:MAG: DNA polymerase domain-containing protein, partial [Candidatus Hermodarchaeota archaeon]|nr:DNA polymerase domain-containing protein [Candidatus Hermodarchaeota archaeon]